MENGYFYLFIDLLGILLLFLSGRWFVRRSLRPLEETYQRQQDFVAAASHELRSPIAVIQMTADAISSSQQRILGCFLLLRASAAGEVP